MENNKFILTGGITRQLGNLLGDGHGAKYAELAELDWERKEIKTLVKLTKKTTLRRKLQNKFYNNNKFSIQSTIKQKI